MIVREVRLENVKSFGSPAEIVRFTRGVNAICGPNGAGKSTVLEAIGCALFQHLPYRHEEFVREGETTGTITVVVESRFDQRTYEVVRRVGKGPQQYVYDPDITQRVAVGESEVRRWLHQHLRIEDEVDLRALFLDSVGPPQGTLTAAFLESPQERRSKFNRLLRVEEYEDAYRKLNALDNALADERHEVEVAMARLEPSIQIRPSLESEKAEVVDRRATLLNQLSRLIAERATLEREIEEYANAEQVWRAAGAALDLALERKRAADDVLARVQREYERAAQARDTCAATRAGRDQFVKAVEGLQALEADQRERDRLLAERHRAELEATRLQNQVSQLDAEISRVEKAARDVTELEKKIPEQEAAEKRLAEAKEAKAEADQLRKRLTGLQEQVKRAAERIALANAAVADAMALHAIADELPTRRARHQERAEALALANRAEGELKALRETIVHDQQKRARLQKQLADLDQQIAAASAIAEGLADLSAVEARHRVVSDERAASLSHLRHAQSTRSQVAGGLCPFLNEACRNLRPGVTLETHFDSEIAHWRAEVGRLDVEFQAMDQQIKRARDAAAKASIVPQLREQRVRLAVDLDESADRLAAGQQKLEAASHLASRRSEVEREEQSALRSLREAERAMQEVSRLSVLRKAAADAQADHDSVEADFKAANARLAQLKDTSALVNEAASALNALNFPREKAQHLRQEVARLGNLQGQRTRASAEHERAARQIEDLDRGLAPYRDLDRTIEDLRRSREQHRADHDRFAAASLLATGIEERATAMKEADDQSRLAGQLVLEARSTLERATRDYDAQAHRDAARRRANLDTSIGDAQARSKEAEREEKRLSGEIQRIRELELELKAQQARLERIDDERQLAGTLRQTIRAAGPEITRQLLTRISRMATRINAEVLNQSGIELEWTPDYDIVTKRQGETRGFAQLSGGEQMAAALAIRLAILRDLSNVRIAFLDEPTAHLDQERRSNLGDQVQRLQGFDQLVVISHDDTFDGLFGHVIRIARENGRSRVLDQS